MFRQPMLPAIDEFSRDFGKQGRRRDQHPHRGDDAVRSVGDSFRQ